LTSLPDPLSSSYRRSRQTNSNTNRDGTLALVAILSGVETLINPMPIH
jgi:hypothetical protein